MLTHRHTAILMAYILGAIMRHVQKDIKLRFDALMGKIRDEVKLRSSTAGRKVRDNLKLCRDMRQVENEIRHCPQGPKTITSTHFAQNPPGFNHTFRHKQQHHIPARCVDETLSPNKLETRWKTPCTPPFATCVKNGLRGH